MQRATLHGRLAQTEGFKQGGIAGPGAEHDALGTDLAAIDAQPGQFASFLQGFDLLASQQAVTGQFGELVQQAWHVNDQFGQAIDLALERAVLQGRWQLLAFDLIDTATHRLAGEEAGQVAGDCAGGPQVMGVGQQAHAGKVQFAVACQRLAPASRHVGNGFGGAGQCAMQGILGAAMNDSLRFEGLLATEAGAFHHDRRVTQAAQTGIEPEACDPCADDQYVGGNNGWHACTSQAWTEAQYTACEADQCPAVFENTWITTTPPTIMAMPSIAGTSSFCP
ncbi:hypothetical protein D3C81_1299950 [compost metagenome]